MMEFPSNSADLQELERFVADNDDLLILEEQIGKFNIFDALDIARVEIRHSNFLAWLLTPSESHGQGDLFLKSLLMDVLRRARQQNVLPPLSLVELDGADLQGIDVRREWRNIDLLIACEEPSFVVAIENKVDSGEHSDQLQRYENIVAHEFPGRRALFVFLTPEGDEASDDDWVSFSYGELHRAFTRTRRANAGAIGGDVAVFLEHYLSLIGNRFMENVDIDKLCRQIYSNHKRALDLIWERVGTPGAGVIGAIKNWLDGQPEAWHQIRTKQREIELIPAAWDKMLPPINKRPTFEPEHWMTLRLTAHRDHLRLYLVVCPTKDPNKRRQLIERLLIDKEEFGLSRLFKKKDMSDEWTRILSDKVCDLPEDDEPDVEAVVSAVEKRLALFSGRTAGIPGAVRVLFGPVPIRPS